MIISSFIVTHLLLFFVGMLSRDLLVEGMETGTNGGMRNQKERGGPSRPHPKKLKTGRHVLQHQSNDFSLTELSFLIRILEEVQENELEQNYSIQDILFENGINLLRGRNILNPTWIAHLIEGNRDNMSDEQYNRLIQENEWFMTEQSHNMDATTGGQILRTIGEISRKIGRELSGPLNKLKKANEILSKYISEPADLNYKDYFFNVELQLVNQIITNTFPELIQNENYENVNTIGDYVGIIFTVNDGSANISNHYVDENEEDYECEPPHIYLPPITLWIPPPPYPPPPATKEDPGRPYPPPITLWIPPPLPPPPETKLELAGAAFF
uniref:Uncharacterized protein n=1 Tax=Meloidogyne javanica TaxID=6303 RepID=A0A915N0L2_MELJA